MGLHLRGRRYNLTQLPKLMAARHDRAGRCQLVGRWRIVDADLWDRDYLDLCGGRDHIGAEGGGEIAFGAMQATLDIEYSRTSIGFAWIGSDEMDEVTGEGTAGLT